MDSLSHEGWTTSLDIMSRCLKIQSEKHKESDRHREREREKERERERQSQKGRQTEIDKHTYHRIIRW